MMRVVEAPRSLLYQMKSCYPIWRLDATTGLVWTWRARLRCHLRQLTVAVTPSGARNAIHSSRVCRRDIARASAPCGRRR
jgi:hypothetical protein